MDKGSIDFNCVELICCKKIFKQFYKKYSSYSYDLIIAGYIEILENKNIFEENKEKFNNDYTLFCFKYANAGFKKYLSLFFNEYFSPLSLDAQICEDGLLADFIPDLSFDIERNINLKIIKKCFKKKFLLLNKYDREIVKDYYKFNNLSKLKSKYHTQKVFEIIEKFKEDFIQCLIDCGYYDNSYLKQYVDRRELKKKQVKDINQLCKQNKKRKEKNFLSCEDIPLINKLIYKNNLKNDCINILSIDEKQFERKIMNKGSAKFLLYEISMLRKKLFPNYSINQLCSL